MELCDDEKLDTINVTYHYTDIFVITALSLRLVEKTPKIKNSVFDTFRKAIFEDTSNEKVLIPRALFVEAKGPEHLLGLMGLHNRIQPTWWDHLIRVSDYHNFKIMQNDAPAPIETLEHFVSKALINLTNRLK